MREDRQRVLNRTVFPRDLSFVSPSRQLTHGCLGGLGFIPSPVPSLEGLGTGLAYAFMTISCFFLCHFLDTATHVQVWTWQVPAGTQTWAPFLVGSWLLWQQWSSAVISLKVGLSVQTSECSEGGKGELQESQLLQKLFFLFLLSPVWIFYNTVRSFSVCLVHLAQTYLLKKR